MKAINPIYNKVISNNMSVRSLKSAERITQPKYIWFARNGFRICLKLKQ